jgi:hypothetical protein
MKQKIMLMGWLLLLVAGLPCTLSAAVLIEYDIAGYPNVGATYIAPSVYDSRLLINDEVIPEPLTMEGLAPMNSGTPGLFFGRGWPIADELNENNYFQFRLIIPPDYKANLDSLTYAFGGEDWNGNSGAENWELHMSYDAFDLHDELLETVDTSGVLDYYYPEADSAMTTMTDLTGLGTRTGEVWFRWYGYGGTGSFASGFMNNSDFGSNVILDGTLTEVPEPMTLTLLASGAVLLGRKRRNNNV